MAALERMTEIGQQQGTTRELPAKSPRFHHSKIGAMRAYDTLHHDPTASITDLVAARRTLIRSGHPEDSLSKSETPELDQTVPSIKSRKETNNKLKLLAGEALIALTLAACGGSTASPTPTSEATPSATVSASATPIPEATPTIAITASPSPTEIPSPSNSPEMTITKENQALIDTWMKGTGIPEGGFVDTNGKPLGFGYISVDSGGVNIFQGEIITGQQIGSNYYVFEGFVRNGVRCFVAFDAGPIDREDYYIFEHSRGGTSVGGLDSAFGLKTSMFAGIMPQLAGKPDLINLHLKTLTNPPSGNADLYTWLNAHLKATDAFANYLKGNAGKPSLVNRIPKQDDQPNAQPAFNEFTLQYPVEAH
jgi:hypothetical protein